MKHHAQALHFRFNEPEIALVGERGIDYGARQRLAEQKVRHQAEAELNQLRIPEGNESGRQEPRN